MFDEKDFTPFYTAFLSLCSWKGVSPSVAARDAGISSGAPTAWKRGAIPKPAQREKLCKYFGVTDDVLLGYVHFDRQGNVRLKEKTPALTNKDRRDVAKDVSLIMESLESSGDLMFDGVPMSEESKAAMAAAMRIGLEEARKRNKATYTPKKYREQKG